MVPYSFLIFSIVNTPLQWLSCSRLHCRCSRLSPSFDSSHRDILLFELDHTNAELLFQQVLFERIIKAINGRLLKLLLTISFGELIYLLVGVFQKLIDYVLILKIDLLKVSTLDQGEIILAVLHFILDLLQQLAVDILEIRGKLSVKQCWSVHLLLEHVQGLNLWHMSFLYQTDVLANSGLLFETDHFFLDLAVERVKRFQKVVKTWNFRVDAWLLLTPISHGVFQLNYFWTGQFILGLHFEKFSFDLIEFWISGLLSLRLGVKVLNNGPITHRVSIVLEVHQKVYIPIAQVSTISVGFVKAVH